MTDIKVHPDCLFSLKTFELLAKLPVEKTQEFYLAHEQEF